jgi:membrane protein YqaA with SNARE-associated domain
VGGLASLAGWVLNPADPLTWALVPYTMLGNSLAMVPYDWFLPAYVVAHDATTGVLLAVAANVLVEFWNMDMLARVLQREGTATFRGHAVTGRLLGWFQRAPWWTLVVAGAAPIIPFYPCRFLATLAHYPMWRYQLAVVVGRGVRYIGLAGLGLLLPIPPAAYFLVGLGMLGVFVYKFVQHRRRTTG